jgi:hypothetical protein
MATYRKDSVDFWPQLAPNAASVRHLSCGLAINSGGHVTSNSLNQRDIRQLAAVAGAGFRRGGHGRGVPSTYEQNFGRNIVLAGAWAECRSANRDHPVIMQHVLGDSA